MGGSEVSVQGRAGDDSDGPGEDPRAESQNDVPVRVRVPVPVLVPVIDSDRSDQTPGALSQSLSYDQRLQEAERIAMGPRADFELEARRGLTEEQPLRESRAVRDLELWTTQMGNAMAEHYNRSAFPECFPPNH